MHCFFWVRVSIFDIDSIFNVAFWIFCTLFPIHLFKEERTKIEQTVFTLLWTCVPQLVVASCSIHFPLHSIKTGLNMNGKGKKRPLLLPNHISCHVYFN